jgi:hypothetical protein
MKIHIYEELQQAFDFYNEKLFEGELPQCIIILTNKENSFGYFMPNSFVEVGNENRFKHTIAMNSEFFAVRDVDFTLSTLVHEMVHEYTFENGVYGRGNYHNKWWAKKMKAVGLLPTDTGEEGGAETGQSVTHKIIPGGIFDQCTKKLLNQKFKLPYVERVSGKVITLSREEAKEKLERVAKNIYKYEDELKNGKIIKASEKEMVFIERKSYKQKAGVRVRYSCGGHNVWGKPGLSITCNTCKKKMEETVVYGENKEDDVDNENEWEEDDNEV